MLNALSHYLQQIPLPSHDAARETAASAEVASASSAANDAGSGSYLPSARAVLVSAVAADFDVRALQGDDVSALQQKLQQYGLVSGRDLNAFAVIHTARTELGDSGSLDAVSLLDDVTRQFGELNTPYSERQQISRLHTLVHNLDSARPRL